VRQIHKKMTQTKTRPASVYLVSGGAKGITAECTIKLAQKQPAKFILLGRSELLEIEPDYAQNCVEEPAFVPLQICPFAFSNCWRVQTGFKRKFFQERAP
jgi:hypothetical protein